MSERQFFEFPFAINNSYSTMTRRNRTSFLSRLDSDRWGWVRERKEDNNTSDFEAEIYEEQTLKDFTSHWDNTKEFEIIGQHLIYKGPFGYRKCIYLDQTASGKSVTEIENFLRTKVLPIYANIHSTTSYCASRINTMREEARDIIHEMCGGGDEDVVIFTGNGFTAGIHKLIGSILKPKDPSPIVIVGPFEHHSNLLPWRTIAKKVIQIPENSQGLLDLECLEKTLKNIKRKAFLNRIIIGSFSVGSNITGVFTDDIAVTIMLHKYGAISAWDYAAAAPHVPIKMNPKTLNKDLDKLAMKDAIIFSGHKFPGGPQTPGVLICKKSIFRNPVPHGHGGGTVLFVTETDQRYLKEITEKNEGGTPDIIGSKRLGIVFKLRQSVTLPYIISRELEFTRQALNSWMCIPQITILGPTRTPRLPIISFMIKHLKTGYYLHHDFIVALLNDLFGIQCRSGCMCAGPYGLKLLGIGVKAREKYEEILSIPKIQTRASNQEEYNIIFKPGYVRISLPYHASQEEIQFAIDSIKFIARDGWKLFPFYEMLSSKGVFRFVGNGLKTFGRKITPSLNDFNNCDTKVYAPFNECLQYAKDLINDVTMMNLDYHEFPKEEEFPLDLQPFRWFLLPSEAFFCMSNSNKLFLRHFRKFEIPFCPQQCYEFYFNCWSEGSVPYFIDKYLE